MPTPSPIARSAPPGSAASPVPSTRPPVVALDGPAGAGKSTVARRLAARLGWRRLDTGAVFRAITWALLDDGALVPDQERAAIVAALGERAPAELDLRLDADGAPQVAGRTLGDAELRSPAVTGLVSAVSEVGWVRDLARRLQRDFVARGGAAVVDGRDMGTVVFPDAPFKFYLDAELDERAARRLRDERAAGHDVTLDGVRAALSERDAGDRSRPLAPLSAAPDAVRVDTTDLDADGVVAELMARISAGGATDRPARTSPGAAAAADAAADREARGVGGLWPPFYWVSHAVAWLCVQLWLRRRRDGVQRVPRQGPVLLVANHASFADPPLVGCGIGRIVHFFARKSLRAKPVFGRMMYWQGALFVDREGSSRSGIVAALEALSAGRMVCVFPEGTRARADEVGPFRRGLLLILRRAAVPVVPVGVRGSRQAFGRGVKFPRPRRCTVHYGEPMAAADVLAPGGLEALRRRIAELADLPLRPAPPDPADHGAV